MIDCQHREQVEQVFTTVKGVLREMDVDAAAEEALVLAAWPEIAGEMLRDRTTALEYADRRLVIEVADATWKKNLEYLAPQMLAKLNRSLDRAKVDLLDFRVRKTGARKGRAGASLQSADVPPKISAAADQIADTALRENFIAAASAYLDQHK
jgi:hypothetical protein